MNTAQILRQSLYDIDAILQNSTTDPFFTQIELLTWANKGKDELEKTLRQAKEDYNLIILQSDDDPFRWAGVTYDPGTLQLTTTSKRVQLPPDCLLLKRVRAITSGYEYIQFRHLDMSHPDFQAIERSTDPPTDILYWDIVGENTFYLANAPDVTLDIEIGYISRSAPLQLYTTGTITLVQDSASVSGGSTSWVINELRNPLDLIVSSDATAPKIVSQTSGGTWVDPSIHYYPVNSINSDGGLTLAGPWLPTGAAGRGYMLATSPSLPEDHHYTIVDYVAYRCLTKARNQARSLFKEAYDAGVAKLQVDTSERQEHDIDCVEDYDPDAY